MLHHHGTPIIPRSELLCLAGRHFRVSFTHPRDGDVCMQIGQSVLWDNGAFSAFTRGLALDERALYAWLDQRLGHPHRAVVLDRIGDDEEAQREMARRWPFPKDLIWKDLIWPVWHLDHSLDYLAELVDHWPGVCFGSAGGFWQLSSPAWERRMDEAFEFLSGDLGDCRGFTGSGCQARAGSAGRWREPTAPISPATTGARNAWWRWPA